MTTKANPNDETRYLGNDANQIDDTTRLDDATRLNDATRVMESAQPAAAPFDTSASAPFGAPDGETPVPPVAPVTARKAKSGVNEKVIYGAAGAVVGAAVGAGVTAMAGGSSDTNLSHAATPDGELAADSTATDAVEVTPEPGMETDTVVTEDTLNDVTPVEPVMETSADSVSSTPVEPVADTPADTVVTEDTLAQETPVEVTPQGAGATVNVNVTVNGEPVEVTPEPAGTVTPVEPAPAPEDAILANSNGIEFAHVSQDVPFAQAFAEARAQVGAGGVFEYQGNLYGTFYAEEWEELTPGQRASFTNEVQSTQLPEATDTAEAPEIEIKSVGTIDFGDGETVNHAEMTIDDTQVVMFDVDNDGLVDVAYVDLNADGAFDESEAIDMTDTGLTMDDIAANM